MELWNQRTKTTTHRGVCGFFFAGSAEEVCVTAHRERQHRDTLDERKLKKLHTGGGGKKSNINVNAAALRF